MRRATVWTSILLALFANSCASGAGDPGAVFFSLSSDGTFRQTTGVVQEQFKPWPLQTRVSDIIAHRDRIFLAVNGQGIAQVVVTPAQIAVRTLSYPPSFHGRTTTAIFPSMENLYCHVYSDTGFSTEKTALPGDRFCFVKINIEKPDLAPVPLISKFQEGNAAWEAVMVRPLDQETLTIQWKLARRDRSVFMYSTFNLERMDEVEKNKEWYLDTCTLQAIDAPGVDPVLSALMKATVDDCAAETDDVVVFFTVHDPFKNTEKRHLFPKETRNISQDTVYSTVRVQRTNDGYLALFSDGRVLRAFSKAEKEITRERLPPLAEGFIYTNIAETDTALCASWEQKDFFKVGGAGILVKRKV